MKHLFRLLIALFAPVYFWIGYSAIRSGKFPITNGSNQWIMKLLRLAADFNHQRALSVYGHLLHLHGENQQSKIQGGIYLQRAADKGDMKAQYMMGKIYENGFASYFTQNNELAIKYYQQAAENNHPIAIQRMIDIYSNGELGKDINQPLADQWGEG